VLSSCISRSFALTEDGPLCAQKLWDFAGVLDRRPSTSGTASLLWLVNTVAEEATTNGASRCWASTSGVGLAACGKFRWWTAMIDTGEWKTFRSAKTPSCRVLLFILAVLILPVHSYILQEARFWLVVVAVLVSLGTLLVVTFILLREAGHRGRQLIRRVQERLVASSLDYSRFC
jgi:hypothetical protein